MHFGTKVGISGIRFTLLNSNDIFFYRAYQSRFFSFSGFPMELESYCFVIFYHCFCYQWGLLLEIRIRDTIAIFKHEFHFCFYSILVIYLFVQIQFLRRLNIFRSINFAILAFLAEFWKVLLSGNKLMVTDLILLLFCER